MWMLDMQMHMDEIRNMQTFGPLVLQLQILTLLCSWMDTWMAITLERKYFNELLDMDHMDHMDHMGAMHLTTVVMTGMTMHSIYQ
jgi:hypothetical protein